MDEKAKPTGSKLSGVCAIIIGLLNVLLILYMVATPAAQRYESGESFAFYSQNPLPLTVTWTVLVLTAVVSLAVVAPAVSDLVRHIHRDLVRITSILATVGWSVMALSFVNLLGKMPTLARTYMTGDSVTQKALVATGVPELDPHGWLMFVCPAIWFITVNILALRGGSWPLLLSWVGVLVGIGYLLTVPAGILGFEILNQVAIVLGATAAPVWYVWMGIRLFKNAAGARRLGVTP